MEETLEEILRRVDKIASRNKRDIFKFVGGGKPTAINLEHVTAISVEDKRITFSFINGGLYVDMDAPETALKVFDELVKIWAADVLG